MKIKYFVLIFGFTVGAAVFTGLFVRGRLASSEASVAKPDIARPWLAAGAVAEVYKAANEKSAGQLAFVSRVIDGDTILVETFDPKTGMPAKQERVRYVGMDTPETVKPNFPVECYGHEASARDKQLVEGKYVWMEKDVSDRDKYGRLLRFVYPVEISSASSGAAFSLASTSIDLELVQEGYARVLTIPPDVAHEAEFLAAASSAQAAGLGFWGACPAYPFQ